MILESVFGLLGAISQRFKGDDDNAVLKGSFKKRLQWAIVCAIGVLVATASPLYALLELVIAFFAGLSKRKPWQYMTKWWHVLLGSAWGVAQLLVMLIPIALFQCDIQVLLYALWGALQGPLWKLSYYIPLIIKPGFLRKYFDWHTAYAEFAIGFVFLFAIMHAGLN